MKSPSEPERARTGDSVRCKTMGKVLLGTSGEMLHVLSREPGSKGPLDTQSRGN